MATINHPLRRPHVGIPIPAPNVRLNGWLVVALTAAALSALLPVLQNSSATSRGFDIQAVEQQKATVLGEISLLESDVARLTSLTRIERRAAEIGLVPATDAFYVSVDDAGPAPAKIPAEYLPGPKAQADGSAPWWRSLFDWLVPLN